MAQEKSEKDSLLHLLIHAKEDSNLVLLYNKIGFQYELNNYDSAIWYYETALKLSKKIGYRIGYIKYIYNYSNILNIRGKLDSSLILNKEAIRLAKELKSPLDIGKSYVNTGNTFLYMGMYDSATIYYETARNYLKDQPEFIAKLSSITMVANKDLGRYPEAIKQGQDALRYYRQEKDSVMVGNTLLNLGNIYVSSGKLTIGKRLLGEALHISQAIDYNELQLSSLLSIGNILLMENKAAHPDYKRYGLGALTLAKKNQDQEGLAIAYRSLGVHYLFARNYPSSLQYLDSSLRITTENKLIREQEKTLQSKSKLFYAMGNLEAGEALQQQANLLADSILSDETRQQVVLAEKRFESERKEAQILVQQSQIRQKNMLNYILIGSASALLLFIYLLYRIYNNRQKLQKQRISELETEKQLLATQSLLKGQEDERSRMAKDLHDGLGGMLSGVKLQLGAMKGNLILTEENGILFNNALNKLDDSISEMRRVAHNMMPEALIKLGLRQALQDYCDGINASNGLHVNSSFHGLESKMNAATEVTIYRIVQELVNNTLKHSGATELLIQVIRQNNSLTITVEDNGKGFNSEGWQDMASAGLQNIRSRVHFLQGNMDIRSSKGKGTSVFIECIIDENE